MERRYARQDWLLLLPALLVLLAFKVVPALAVVAIAFTQWRILGRPAFIALDNFARMLHDPIFGKTLVNTLFYVAVVTPALTAGSLGFALLTEALGTGRQLFRLVYFMPVVVPFSIIATMWKSAVYSPFGLVNRALEEVGIGRVNFLGTDLAALSVSVVIVWAQLGLFSLFFVAGLKTIPQEVKEAAAIDGASGLQVLRYITLPLLRPSTLLVTVVSTVAAFRAFDVVYVLTGGGPNYASASLLVYLYEAGWTRFEMGYAASLALVFCVIAVLFNVVQRALLRETSHAG